MPLRILRKSNYTALYKAKKVAENKLLRNEIKHAGYKKKKFEFAILKKQVRQRLVFAKAKERDYPEDLQINQ